MNNVLPKTAQEFGEELAKLAERYGLERCAATFHLSYESGWCAPINLFWQDGRHGADRRRYTLTSHVEVRMEIKP